MADFPVSSMTAKTALKNLKAKLPRKVTFLGFILRKGEHWVEWKVKGESYGLQKPAPTILTDEYFQVLETEIAKTYGGE